MSFSMLRIYGDYKMIESLLEDLKEAVILLLKTEAKRLEHLPYDGTEKWYHIKKEIGKINKMIGDLENE